MRLILFTAIAATLMLPLVLAGCGDGGGKDNGGAAADGKYNIIGFAEKELDGILVSVDTVSDSGIFINAKLRFVNLPAGKIPKTGDIIVSGPTTAAIGGLLYKATKVFDESGAKVVEARSAGLHEILKGVSLDDFTFDSSDGGEWGTIDDDGVWTPLAPALRKNSANAASPNTTLIRRWNLGAADYTGTVNVKGGIIDISANLNLFLNFSLSIDDNHNIEFAKMTLTPSGNVLIYPRVAEIKWDAAQFELAEIPLPPITFAVPIPIPPYVLPVTIKNDASLSLKISGAVDVDFSGPYDISAGGEFGFVFANGEFSEVNKPQFNSGPTVEQTVSGNMTASVVLSVESKLYGMLGLNAGFGPGGQLVATGVTRGGSYGYFPLSATGSGAGMEAKLNYGYEWGINAEVAAWSFELAGGFKTLGTVHTFNFLPSVTDGYHELVDLVLTSDGSEPCRIRGVNAGYHFARPEMLDYKIDETGICLSPASNPNACKNGGGLRKTAGGAIPLFGEESIQDGFTSHEYGEQIYGKWIPSGYFKNWLGSFYFSQQQEIEIEEYDCCQDAPEPEACRCEKTPGTFECFCRENPENAECKCLDEPTAEGCEPCDLNPNGPGCDPCDLAPNAAGCVNGGLIGKWGYYMSGEGSFFVWMYEFTSDGKIYPINSNDNADNGNRIGDGQSYRLIGGTVHVWVYHEDYGWLWSPTLLEFANNQLTDGNTYVTLVKR